MWIVAKVKNRNFNVFKESFSEKMGRDVQFYHPKIEFHKYLGNKIKRFESDIIDKIKSDEPEIINEIQSTGKLDEKTEKSLSQIIEKYKTETK